MTESKMHYDDIGKAHKLKTELEKVNQLIDLMKHGDVHTRLNLKATPANSKSSYDLHLYRVDAETVLIAYRTCLIANLQAMGIQMRDEDEIYNLPNPDNCDEDEDLEDDEDED